MNPYTLSASWKKIHLFLWSVVEGHVYFVYLSLKFSFYGFSLFKLLPLYVETLCCKIWSWLYMSSYILSCCSGRILVMMFRFRGCAVLSVCCGEWVHLYSWERKGKNIDVYFSDQCSTGPEANILYSAIGIFSWLLWTVGSYLCLSSAEHFSMFPLRAVTFDRPGIVDAWITELEGAWFVVCGIVSQSI